MRGIVRGRARVNYTIVKLSNSNNHGGPMGGNGGYFIDISPSMSEVAGGFTYVGGQTYTSEFLSRLVGCGCRL